VKQEVSLYYDTVGKLDFTTDEIPGFEFTEVTSSDTAKGTVDLTVMSKE
jgi:hypothetical protein